MKRLIIERLIFTKIQPTLKITSHVVTRGGSRGTNERLPGRYVAALLHERCKRKPEAVDDAEIVRHAGRRNVRRSLRSVRMLQRGVVSRGHRRISAAA